MVIYFQWALDQLMPMVFSTSKIYKSSVYTYINISILVLKFYNNNIFFLLLYFNLLFIYYYVCTSYYRYDLTVDEAIELGKRAILHATHRDAYSGGINNGKYYYYLYY